MLNPTQTTSTRHSNTTISSSRPPLLLRFLLTTTCTQPPNRYVQYNRNIDNRHKCCCERIATLKRKPVFASQAPSIFSQRSYSQRPAMHQVPELFHHPHDELISASIILASHHPLRVRTLVLFFHCICLLHTVTPVRPDIAPLTGDDSSRKPLPPLSSGLG